MSVWVSQLWNDVNLCDSISVTVAAFSTIQQKTKKPLLFYHTEVLTGLKDIVQIYLKIIIKR